MNVAFTLCSNNYLAQAKTLADSFRRYNQNYQFIIGLIDRKKESVDYNIFEPSVIATVEELAIDGFDEMVLNYNIIELCTAAKPFYFKYIFEKYRANNVIYLDPDIMVYDNFGRVEEDLINYSIIVTPHVISPIELDNSYPDENLFLSHGIYNLGFLALSKTAETYLFLDWWAERLKVRAYINLKEGMFTDQLYVNLVPIYFKSVKIEFSVGFNMAYWNLHERKIKKIDGVYKVNGKENLLFFHFSSHNPLSSHIIAKGLSRYTLQTRSDLIGLFKEYDEILVKNRYEYYKNIACYFVETRNEYLHQKEMNWIFSSRRRASIYYIRKWILSEKFILKLKSAVKY